MELKNTVLLRDTEAFMRGELDNVTVAEGNIRLDMVQGSYVPYGCYTTPALPMPVFDALRVSWNASTPRGTAVEMQARLMVDGNWTGWTSFGRWSPYISREGAAEMTRGALTVRQDQLLLDSKTALQAQLRIYLYTKDDKQTPGVSLIGASVKLRDVIPAGGRPVNDRLHLLPYVVARRAPALRPVMDLAICLCSLTNRWGADLLPEELALAMWDRAKACDPRNPSFAAAVAGCWGFPTWVRWADLALLRAEIRAGFGIIVALDSTPAQCEAGLPAVRYAAVRGFRHAPDGQPMVLLIDPWAGEQDFDAETEMPLDEFLVAWNNLALCMRNRPHGPTAGCPERAGVRLRHPDDASDNIYRMTLLSGDALRLPDEFCGDAPVPDGVLAWSIPDEHPHATTAHRLMHYTAPEEGGIRLENPTGNFCKFTVYAIDSTGKMLVGDVVLS